MNSICTKVTPLEWFVSFKNIWKHQMLRADIDGSDKWPASWWRTWEQYRKKLQVSLHRSTKKFFLGFCFHAQILILDIEKFIFLVLNVFFCLIRKSLICPYEHKRNTKKFLQKQTLIKMHFFPYFWCWRNRNITCTNQIQKSGQPVLYKTDRQTWLLQSRIVLFT